MAQSDVKKLLLSRMRILCKNGFYGLLLMHIRYGLDKTCPTACTDGNTIFFNPEFLDSLSDGELDFVMMHEILHVVLKHCFRSERYDPFMFNVACDIVVNSNILYSNDMDISSISIDGEPLIHKAPNGEEGWRYTAEEVYEMFPENYGGKARNGQRGSVGGGKSGQRGNVSGGKIDGGGGESFDDHSRWKSSDSELDELWTKYFKDAAEAIENQERNGGRGLVPMFAKRMLNELKNPQIDWRTVLNEFVQEEVTDYSFTPPDRRFDGDFFLPDFSDTEAVVKDILFMIDASGSMSDEMVTAAFSEVKGAIEQFNGKLKGRLGYFDAGITEPVPFESVTDLIKPIGRGGTDFGIIFRYVERHMQDNPPASIIILTDGYAPFPKESKANGIPVLWLLNNSAITPPWGKIARIKISDIG